ncbi:MAG: endonuclease/exonuclease/phosphatase family protein [Bacteroidetes bacterium]|nr:endonuclease/exonuclease/phosphatase family protein [Bacteroidota bacterium]
MILWLVKLKKELLISLIIIMIGWGYIKRVVSFHGNSLDKETRETIIDAEGSDIENKNSINLLSYNVRLFNIFNQSKDENAGERILELISGMKPDLCCLQELYIDNKRGISLEELKKNLSSTPYSNIAWANRVGKKGYYGIATFSKFPMVNKGVIRYPNSKNISIYSDIVIDEDTLRIYNNHLQSVRFNRRNFNFLVNLDLQSEEETILELRDISSRLKNAYIKRAEQADILSEHIQNSPYHVIVCGDFNDTPVSYSYRKIKGDLNDAFTVSGRGLGNTYSGTFPKVRIDYIFYSDEFSVFNFQTTKVKYSDHYPVSCSLRFHQ